MRKDSHKGSSEAAVMIARVIRCVNQNLSNAKDTHPRGCRSRAAACAACALTFYGAGFVALALALGWGAASGKAGAGSSRREVGALAV